MTTSDTTTGDTRTVDTRTTVDLLVIGAGPAGLARAFWATRDDPERSVAVLESATRTGGWAQSLGVDGYTLELGPQALRPDDPLDAIVAALGIEAEVLAASPLAKKRFIGRDQRLIPTPSGPLSAIGTKLLPFGAKLRLLKEPWVKERAATDDESLADFVGRRFGRHTVPLVQAMVSGIYAGDAARLEAGAAFPLLVEAERAHGSVIKGLKARAKAARAARNGAPRPKRPALVSFRGGLHRLMRALTDALGDRVRTGAEVVAITRDGERFAVDVAGGGRITARELCVAAPARHAAAMFRSSDPELAAELAAIPFASLASVYLGMPQDALADGVHGFGFLLEPGEPSPVLGGLLASDLFPDHAPAGRRMCRVMMGGARHPQLLEQTDAELVDIAIDTLRRYAGLRVDPDVLHVERVRSGIPQYERGHVARLRRIRERCATQWPGLRLAGNSYDAIAMVPQLRR
ncbi:MAG: protoporphyrinogen oxidase [Planctomycetes bacterium]|nr:protoporphyrinogen oxidase [Planctomycetota bacterium]